jgi:hypothetical protein
MDQETTEYIDKKFAEAEAAKEAKQQQAKDFIQSRMVKTKKIVYYCASLMLILLGVMVWLLLKAQFLPRH